MNLDRSAGRLALMAISLFIAASCSPSSTQTAPSARAQPATVVARPVQLWDRGGLDSRILGQWEVDSLPQSPYMLRVTELEMEPGARVFDHVNLGPGGHVVLTGTITIVDSVSGAAVEYGERSPQGSAYFEGMTVRHRAENRGVAWNRVFTAEVLSRSRGFLGNQQFDQEGVLHNEGGVRSGPYAQEPIESLPESPLIVRVSEIKMGPKAKTTPYTRPGPGLFFVASGQATFRHDEFSQIQTTGAGGYYLDPGVEPVILENKPITEAKLLVVEFLPASLGKAPSTVPAGS